LRGDIRGERRAIFGGGGGDEGDLNEKARGPRDDQTNNKQTTSRELN
jgi:hypothetical protein